jgi:hypothetical protein
LWPQWPLEFSWQQLVRWPRTAAARQVRILDPEPFLTDVEPHLPGRPLPHEWQATSDSIAARVAHALDADDLVLLKSAVCRDNNSLQGAADQGYFDPFFPQAAEGLPLVRSVNLRDAEGPETVWIAAD